MTDSTAARGVTLRDRVRGNWRWVLSAVVVTVAVAAYVPLAQSGHHELSPVDEYVYADYVLKIPSQGIVRRGEETGDAARDLIACRGVLFYGDFGSACGAPSHPEDATYPYAGATGADIYTPVYFAVTWVVAKVISPATGGDVFVAARLAGAVWLLAGVLAFFALLARFRVHPWMSAGLALAIVAAPAVLWSNTYVSTDAPAILAGSLMCYLALRVSRGELASWWLPVVAPVMVLLKVQHLSVVALAVGFVLVRVIHAEPVAGFVDSARRLRRDPRARGALLAMALAVTVQGGWLYVRSAIAVGPSTDQGLASTSKVSGILAETVKFLGQAGQSSQSLGTVRDTVGVLLSWLCIAGVIGLVLAVPRSSLSPSRVESGRLQEGRDFAVVVLIVAMLAGPVLAIGAVAVGGESFALPTRYGLSLVPAFLACFGLLAPKSSRLAIGAFAAGAVAVAVTIVAAA